MSFGGVPVLPALVAGEVIHTRHVERDDHFRYASLQWLVDVDDLPSMVLRSTLYDIDAADHLRGNGFRHDLDDVLRDAGLPSTDGCDVLMFTQPRIAGRVFDPLTVYWILVGDACAAVVLEVHNTYGERHAYVLPGEPKTVVDKDFYVSPFNDTKGEYRVRWHLERDRVQVTVNLHRDDVLVLAATVGGAVEPLTAELLRRAVKRVPGRGFRVPALIRWHGIRLWFRRMSVQPRPENGGNLGRPVPHQRSTL